MNCNERFNNAVTLNTVDRIPVAPMISFFAATHCHVKVSEFIYNQKTAFEAIRKTFEDLGGYDAMCVPFGYDPLLYAFEVPIKLLLPGKELPETSIWQAHEIENMTVGEYDIIIDKGWNHYYYNYLFPRIREGYGGSLYGRIKIYMKLLWLTAQMRKPIQYWNRKGIPMVVGSAIAHPFEVLSAARSMNSFFIDMYERPEKIENAMKKMIQGIIREGMSIARLTKIPRISIGGTRGSNQFISLEHFEHFYFPYLKTMVETLFRNGYISVLHFDSDWTQNLSYLKQLPKGSCILQLDSFTDIVKAHDILSGHLCIMGDVPASMLAFGNANEVEKYCLDLKKLFGNRGGFILSSGCEVPANAKFENVKAMLDAVKS